MDNNPWTLPSNVALAVKPNETYVEIKCSDETYIMAEALVEKVVEEEYEIINKRSGQSLLEWNIIHFFNFAKPDKKAYYIIGADFVTLSDGTGLFILLLLLVKMMLRQV